MFLTAGVAVLVRPLEGYVGLSLLFSLVILAVGITQVAFAVSNRAHLKGWGWSLASGILDIAIGIYLYMYPLVTMATLPYFVGFWLLLRAFYLMGFAMDLGDAKVSGWGWLLTGGILVAIGAFLVLYYPVAGAVS
ncbi:MAG TPA: DUF308 domain-containing protein, partial [bacterium]|nr:DUF308 domain-containing protein [bacterium]